MKRESSPVLIPAMRSSTSPALALLTWQHKHTSAIVFVCVLASHFPLIRIHLQLWSIQEKQSVNLKISHVCVLTPFSQAWFNTTAGERWVFSVHSTFNCDMTNGSSKSRCVFMSASTSREGFKQPKGSCVETKLVADGSDIGCNTKRCESFSSVTKQVAGHREWKHPRITASTATKTFFENSLMTSQG